MFFGLPPINALNRALETVLAYVPPVPERVSQCCAALKRYAGSILVDLVIAGAATGISVLSSNDDDYDPARGVMVACASVLFLKEVMGQPWRLLTTSTVAVSSGLIISALTGDDRTNLVSDAFSLSTFLTFSRIALARFTFHRDVRMALHDADVAVPFNGVFHVLILLSKVASTFINAAYENAEEANLPRLPPVPFWIGMYTALGTAGLWLAIDFYKLNRTIARGGELNSNIHKITQFFLTVCHCFNVMQGLGMLLLSLARGADWQWYTAFSILGLVAGVWSGLYMPPHFVATLMAGEVEEKMRKQIQGVIDLRPGVQGRHSETRNPEAEPILSAPSNSSSFRLVRQSTHRVLEVVRVVVRVHMERPLTRTTKLIRAALMFVNTMNSIRLLIALIAFGYGKKMDARTTLAISLSIGLVLGIPAAVQKYYSERIERCKKVLLLWGLVNGLVSNAGDVAYAVSLLYGVLALATGVALSELGQQGKLINNHLNIALGTVAIFICMRSVYLSYLADSAREMALATTSEGSADSAEIGQQPSSASMERAYNTTSRTATFAAAAGAISASVATAPSTAENSSPKHGAEAWRV